jgi:hypothetical protein
MILNMFRASLCSFSGGQLYIYSIWYRPTLYAAIRCTDEERTAVRVYTMMHGQKTIKVYFPILCLESIDAKCVVFHGTQLL